MKSRTGLCMSLGKGSIYAASINKNLNTTNSTESELVRVLDDMPKMVWIRYFVEAQEHNVEDVYLYQYNQSAILLEINGMRYVGKKSRHIRIKYFFVTDRVKNNELKITYCPTKGMVSDFFTKPLQSVFFITHCNTVLGITEENVPCYRRQYEEYITQRNNIDAT